jgi:hypothetical protein
MMPIVVNNIKDRFSVNRQTSTKEYCLKHIATVAHIDHGKTDSVSKILFFTQANFGGERIGATSSVPNALPNDPKTKR